jgi:hypothetical protein
LVGSDALALAELGITSGAPHGIRVIWSWFAVIDSSAEFGYVAEIRHFGPACFQHLGRVVGQFTERHRATAGPFSRERKSTDAREQIQNAKLGIRPGTMLLPGRPTAQHRALARLTSGHIQALHAMTTARGIIGESESLWRGVHA